MRQRSSHAARGRSCAHPPRAAPPMRFYVPLATSPPEFGLLGLSTPDTFRPWPFSDLRRFTPPTASLSCFIQAPPMDSKNMNGVALSLAFRRWFVRRFPASETPDPNVLPAEADRVDLSQTPPRVLPLEQHLAFCRVRRCVTHLDAPRTETPREEGTPTRQTALTLPVKSRLPPPRWRLTRRPNNATDNQIRKPGRHPFPSLPPPPTTSVAKTIHSRVGFVTVVSLGEHSSLTKLTLPSSPGHPRAPVPFQVREPQPKRLSGYDCLLASRPDRRTRSWRHTRLNGKVATASRSQLAEIGRAHV